MSITITIPAELEILILGKAKAAGKPVEEVTVGLIAQGLQQQPPALTFDEILAPFRKEVAESGITDEELDALFMQARRDYARENQEQD
ncbi:MAG TPA: hypothetical protein VGB07_13830 [Blastocatellia bacterium]|jgi:hypothetical protein